MRKSLFLAVLVAGLVGGAAMAQPTSGDVTSTITNSGSSGTGTQAATTPASGAGSCDEVAQSLGACSVSTAGSSTTASSVSTSSGGTLNGLIANVQANSTTCHLCSIINDLESGADAYTANLTSKIATATLSVWNKILLLAITWFFFRILVTGQVQFLDLMTKAGLAILVTTFLSNAQAGASGFFWSDIYMPLRATLTGLASGILSDASGITIPTQIAGGGAISGTFTSLAGAMENSLFVMVLYGVKLASFPGTGSIIDHLTGSLVNVVAGIGLSGPFFVLIIIFFVFVGEAVFFFMGVTAISPILIVCAFFKPLRQGLVWAFRVYLNCGLTLIFASIFIGFAMREIQQYITALANSLDAQSGAVFFNFDYWKAVAIGDIAIFFVLSSKKLADSLSGIHIGVSSAVQAVAGLTALTALGAKTLMGSGGKGGQAGQTGQAVANGVRTAKDWVTGYRTRRKAPVSQ
jgi:hypothetical protein